MEISLLELKPNYKAKILRLEGGYGLQRKLRNLGVREGKTIKLITKEPLRGPFVIEIERRQTITMGRGLAQRIILEVIK